MSRLKNLFLMLLFSINLYGVEVVIVNSKLDYKEIIHASKLSASHVKKVKKYCIPMTLDDFKNKKYIAKRYLRKGTILCTRDVEEFSKHSVLFSFGVIEVEKPGEIIYENDEYIKIKKLDGKIEKIYKDGRIQ